MHTFKRLFFLLAIVCLPLTSCRVSRQVVKTAETAKSETRQKIVNYRDTVFYTPKVSTSLKLPISELRKCPETSFKEVLKDVEKPRIFTQKNGNAKATVKIMHDTVTVTAECDSLALAAKIRSEYQEKFENSVLINSELIEKNTRANWWLIIGLMLVALVVGFISGKLT